jgi:hypothetical protein
MNKKISVNEILYFWTLFIVLISFEYSVFQNFMYLNKDRTVDNIHKHNNYFNTPSSQTLRSHIIVIELKEVSFRGHLKKTTEDLS